MPTSPLSPSLSPFSDTAALEWLCAALAVLLALVAWFAWRQWRVLRSARSDMVQLREEAAALRRQRAADAGTASELDSQRAAARQAGEREAVYASLINAMPGAAYRCTADDSWTVLFISEAIQGLSGWSPADYLASPELLRELVHPQEHARVTAEVQAAIDADRSYTLEYRAVHRDGHVFWAWERGKAQRDAGGRVLWLDGVVVDISERKAMEQALRDAKDRAEQAVAAKTQFLANMGHEVRTPLNAIIGFSEIVLRNELDSLQRQYVFKVRQAATTLLRLMNDILDMAKLERNQLQCVAADFSLRELAQQALAAQRQAAEHKGLALRLDAEPGLGDAFRGDAARLRQALDKLLDNAVKFTEEGTVRLQLARQQGQVLLAVHDTGIGIAAHDQARIFEAFSQADGSASRRFGGTGLGITLARQLVEHMGGTLTVHSAPGEGSVFRVLVPLADAAVAPTEPAVANAEHETVLPAGLQALFDDAPAQDEQPWRDSLRATVHALRNGDQSDTDLPLLLQRLRGRGLAHHAAQVEQALARFDLDRAAELLETLPARV
nr:PAS domain-containing hybrid sensor histidine kinase/response regulator [Variovorax boronicumulans]